MNSEQIKVISYNLYLAGKLISGPGAKEEEDENLSLPNATAAAAVVVQAAPAAATDHVPFPHKKRWE